MPGALPEAARARTARRARASRGAGLLALVRISAHLRMPDFRGWSPYGARPSNSIKNITVELYDYMSYGDVDMYELRTDLTILLERNEITVHGKAVKLELEQSCESNIQYAQFMEARDRLRDDDDDVCDDDYLASFTDCQRSLRLFSAGSWEVLGGLGPHGWTWNRDAFTKSGTRLPSFLSADGGDNHQINSTDDDDDARDAGRGGEKRRSDDHVGGDDRQDRQPESSAAEGAVTDCGHGDGAPEQES